MIGLRFALLASIGLVGVNSQCLSESAALGTCLDEVGGFEDATELACEACLEAIVLGAFAGPCEGVSSTVCADIADCPCGDLCDSNILSYMTCEINEERMMEDCPPIVCSAEDTPTATPAVGDTPTALPTTASAETPPPADGGMGPAAAPASSSSPLCAAESVALGTCLDDVAGFEDAAELACETCLEAVALAAFAGPCDDVTSTVCTDIADCPCGDLCETEILNYMTCEINEERTGEDCPPIVCSTADTPTATPAAGDTPTAAPVTADTPTDAPAAGDTPTDTPATTTGDDTASPTEAPTPTSSASSKNPILFYKSLFGIVTVVGFLWN